MLFKHLLVASLMVSTLAQEIQENNPEDLVVKTENENSEEIKRQNPPQPGWGGLISGKIF